MLYATMVISSHWLSFGCQVVWLLSYLVDRLLDCSVVFEISHSPVFDPDARSK
jgi:hypothetical protein